MRKLKLGSHAFRKGRNRITVQFCYNPMFMFFVPDHFLTSKIEFCLSNLKEAFQ